MSLAAWIGVALAGGAGSLARALAAEALTGAAGTVAINFAGSLALGLLTGAEIGGTGLAVAGAGFLGAFTTFSAWMLDADGLPAPDAARHLALALGGGLVLYALGRLIGGLA